MLATKNLIVELLAATRPIMPALAQRVLADPFVPFALMPRSRARDQLSTSTRFGSLAGLECAPSDRRHDQERKQNHQHEFDPIRLFMRATIASEICAASNTYPRPNGFGCASADALWRFPP